MRIRAYVRIVHVDEHVRTYTAAREERLHTFSHGNRQAIVVIKETDEGTKRRNKRVGWSRPAVYGALHLLAPYNPRERDLCGPTLRPTLHSIHYLLMVAALALGARLSLVYDMPRPTKRPAVVRFFLVGLAECTTRGRAIVPRDRRRDRDRDRGRIAMILRLTSPRTHPRASHPSHPTRIGRARVRRPRASLG